MNIKIIIYNVKLNLWFEVKPQLFVQLEDFTIYFLALFAALCEILNKFL